MKTQFRIPQDVVDLVNDYADVNDKLDLLQNIKIVPEHVINIPFSDRLNRFIRDWFRRQIFTIKYVDVDDFDPENIEKTLDMHITRWQQLKEIHIWTGESKNSIFGNEETNWLFRTWHDYTHITHNIGYDLAGEIEVCGIQQAQLPLSWGYERTLIHSEIIGQALHHQKYGEFVKDQRGFTLEFLKTGEVKKF